MIYKYLGEKYLLKPEPDSQFPKSMFLVAQSYPKVEQDQDNVNKARGTNGACNGQKIREYNFPHPETGESCAKCRREKSGFCPDTEMCTE